MKNAECKSAIRNPNSAIESVGPDAENERSDSQIAMSASDVSPVAMQQLDKGPVGSPAAKRKHTATRNPFRRIERNHGSNT